MAKAKTIKILLGDGTLDGLVTVEDSSWEGVLLIAPRDKIDELFSQKQAEFWGVYILASGNNVYIGQASELKRRIKQHNAGFGFWDKVILITTKDDSLNRSAIDYIETDLIDKASRMANLHSENKQSGNKQKVSIFEKVPLDNYIENAILLLELLGIFAFSPKKQKQSVRQKNNTKNGFANALNPCKNAESKKADFDTSVELYLEENVKNSGLTVKASCTRSSEGYIVLSGSTINPIVNEETCSGVAKRARDNAKIQNDILLEDMFLPSPSAAAMFVIGASRNGYTSWKNADGKTLKEIETDEANKQTKK